MQSDIRYRFITLLVGFGFIAVVLLFLALVRIAADAHVDLDQLPAPVLGALRERAGDETTLVQVFRGSTPNDRAYHIVLKLHDGSSESSGSPRTGASGRRSPSRPGSTDSNRPGADPCPSSWIN